MRYLLIAMVILVSLPLSGAVIYEYDGAGRLTRVDYGNGKVIAYRYDNAGNLVGRTSATSRRRRPVRRAEAVAPPRVLAAVRPDSTREEATSLKVVDGVASTALLPPRERSAVARIESLGNGGLGGGAIPLCGEDGRSCDSDHLEEW